MNTTKGLSRGDFDKRFGDNEACLEFIGKQKWSNRFICRKCHHTLFLKGKKSPFKRCLQCGTEELQGLFYMGLPSVRLRVASYHFKIKRSKQLFL
jgi:hypothetical protein